MPRSLTAADAIIMLAVPGLFSTPQQLQGFAADNVYDIGTQEITETQMGVDGILSAGFVFNAVEQTYSIQADSVTNDLFELWAASQRQQKTVFRCSGSTTLKAVGKSYISTNGALISFPPLPAAGKILQPRKYMIRWESVQPVPNA